MCLVKMFFEIIMDSQKVEKSSRKSNIVYPVVVILYPGVVIFIAIVPDKPGN